MIVWAVLNILIKFANKIILQFPKRFVYKGVILEQYSLIISTKINNVKNEHTSDVQSSY